MDINHRINNTNQRGIAEHRRIHNKGKTAASTGESTVACPYDGVKRRTWMSGYDEQKLLGQGLK